MSINRSAYYDYRRGKTYRETPKKAACAQRVKECFALHRRRYGTRRIAAELKIGRSAKWTISKLLKIKQRKLRVMAIGGLFYDNDHVVNANENDPISRQPARFSLWEVHPIRQFFVCPRPDGNCRVNTLTDWVALDDF